MKIKNILSVTLAVSVISTGAAYAANCSTSTYPDSTYDWIVQNNCKTATYTNYMLQVSGQQAVVRMESCTSCNTGSSLKYKTYQDTGWSCSVPNVGYCCDGKCGDCYSGAWTNHSTTGYQVRAYATCNTSTCQCNSTYSYEYRCAAGYYGTSTNGTSGCTKCPSSGGVAGQSVPGSNTAITGCYIPSGSSFSDSTGSGTYTGDCYWKN